MGNIEIYEIKLKQRNRKLAGVFLMIGLLIIYPAFAVIFYENLLAGLNIWILLIYFAIAGLAWAIPAGLLIKWMARPD